jgi:alkaline phosphatase D
MSCGSTPKAVVDHGIEKNKSYKIAFGSCSHQNKNQGILYLVCNRKPDVFIYLGDNIYGDTRNMSVLKSKYDKLAAKPEFQRLQKTTDILATWDDHDYGENDAGRHYPFKEESREIFLDFWNVPKDSERRQHKGVYHALMLDNTPLKTQVILLDTRTFRDNLTRMESAATKYSFQPTESPDSTFLGEEQWAWLKKELKKEADLRIIASSNQFAHEHTGWESWTNVPHEKEKMLTLINTTKANGIVFLSGDVHWGELSKQVNDQTYPIYDLTSSGLTQSWSKAEHNGNRQGDVVRKNNFGLIEIGTKNGETTLTFKLVNKLNITRVKHTINLSELDF